MSTKDKSGIITFNSMKIEKGLKIISLYIDNGVYKFLDIIKDIYASNDDELSQFFNEIKIAYAVYYEMSQDDIAEQMDSNIRGITYDYFINTIKLEAPKLSQTEILGRKQLMEFLETLIQNFKLKKISSNSLMCLSKAYYLLDNYKKSLLTDKTF